jgi:hypothetical protein
MPDTPTFQSLALDKFVCFHTQYRKDAVFIACMRGDWVILRSLQPLLAKFASTPTLPCRLLDAQLSPLLLMMQEERKWFDAVHWLLDQVATISRGQRIVHNEAVRRLPLACMLLAFTSSERHTHAT